MAGDLYERRNEWLSVLHDVPVTFPGGGLPMVNLNVVLDALAAHGAPARDAEWRAAVARVREATRIYEADHFDEHFNNGVHDALDALLAAMVSP